MIERTIVQPACDIPVGFAGQFGVLREPNGLYYMNARYYDPAMGRFLSEDPVGLSGGDLTLYSYAGNNLVVFVDPSGLCRIYLNGNTSEPNLGPLGTDPSKAPEGFVWHGKCDFLFIVIKISKLSTIRFPVLHHIPNIGT